MRPLLELRAENFRSLRDVTVGLEPLNVLVGPNGAGKSNLLDVIRFLSDSARADLRPALDRRGGYERMRFRGKSSGKIRISVRANVTTHSSPTAPDEYDLAFSLDRSRNGPEARHLLVREESFRFKRTQGRGRRITVRGSTVDLVDTGGKPGTERTQRLGLRRDALGLAALARLSPDQGGDEIERVASLFSTFRVFDPDVPAARLPSKITEDPLRENAANLASFLYLLHERSGSFDDLEDDARAMVPGLRSIRFQDVGGTTSAIAVQLEEQGLATPTDLADASYGTIRALALLALLYDPDPPLLTCIEEIDHGLHPYVFDRLVELLRAASEKTQFLIATHSPAFVNRLTPEELIVCERDESGASKIPAVESSVIRQMEDATEGRLRLGELWFTGSLGGVPA